MRRSWKAWLNSIAGLTWAARHETAFQQELAALAVALPASFFVTNDGLWRSILIASVLFVIMVELVNTAIERLSDHVTPEHHPTIKVVKDLGSAAVLVAIAIAGSLWLTAMVTRLA